MTDAATHEAQASAIQALQARYVCTKSGEWFNVAPVAAARAICDAFEAADKEKRK